MSSTRSARMVGSRSWRLRTLPEAASFVSRVELVAVDAGPDAGAGDVQAKAVVAAGFVGDAGELQGGALAPRDSHQLLSDVDRVGVVWAQPVDRRSGR